MALTMLEKPDVTSILAQYKRARETVTAAHHSHDTGTYLYTVRIDGGPHNGVEFHCRTFESTVWLFDQVVRHRENNIDWLWLWPVESL